MEKVESLEQAQFNPYEAARKFLREHYPNRRPNPEAADQYEFAISLMDLPKALTQFAAERERQVWAEAAKRVGKIYDEPWSLGMGAMGFVEALIIEFRARGEQVK